MDGVKKPQGVNLLKLRTQHQEGGVETSQSLPCDRVQLLHHTEQAPLPTLNAGEQQGRGCGHRGHLKIYNQQQPLSSATAVSVPGSPHQPGLEHRFVLSKDGQTLAPAFANGQKPKEDFCFNARRSAFLLYTILAYKRFHRNTFLPDSRGNL